MSFLLRNRAHNSLKIVTKVPWYLLTGSRRRLSSTSQHGDPHALKVLFCGSDEFSIQSLEALHRYAQSERSKVHSIEVATRTDKRTGRGLKNITAPPIKDVAQRLGLALHQFDTFRGWNLPTIEGSQSTYINMIIAVSFGLLIPPRILNACQFGGLNVHPSLLPDLKGSAPVEHAIIHGYEFTGLTIQTLHPSRFDEGQIVLQTPKPGIAIPNPDQITSTELKDVLAPIGADMLVQTLQNGLYLQGPHDQKPLEDAKHAPKISQESRHIDLRKLDVPHILKLNRALSRLWIRVQGAQHQEREIRLILGSKLRLAQPQDLHDVPSEVISDVEVGLPFAIVRVTENIKQSSAPLFVKTSDSNLLLIPEILVSGMRAGLAAAKAAKADLFKKPSLHGQYNLYQFKALPD